MSGILGIDPGNSVTGWALVSWDEKLMGRGVLRPSGRSRAEVLSSLFSMVRELVEELVPDTAAVEGPFVGRNPRSGLALAEARGTILAALGLAGVPVESYSPARVRYLVVGNGRASVEQVRYVIERVVGGIGEGESKDVVDAVAVALAHVRQLRFNRNVAGTCDVGGVPSEYGLRRG